MQRLDYERIVISLTGDTQRKFIPFEGNFLRVHSAPRGVAVNVTLDEENNRPVVLKSGEQLEKPFERFWLEFPAGNGDVEIIYAKDLKVTAYNINVFSNIAENIAIWSLGITSYDSSKLKPATQDVWYAEFDNAWIRIINLEPYPVFVMFDLNIFVQGSWFVLAPNDELFMDNYKGKIYFISGRNFCNIVIERG